GSSWRPGRQTRRCHTASYRASMQPGMRSVPRSQPRLAIGATALIPSDGRSGVAVEADWVAGIDNQGQGTQFLGPLAYIMDCAVFVESEFVIVKCVIRTCVWN